jgi:hypothetical protein
MVTVQGKRGGPARGVTRKNPRNGRPCPRCHRFGTYAPNALVCDRCLGALPLVFTVRVTVTVAVTLGASAVVIGGGR